MKRPRVIFAALLALAVNVAPARADPASSTNPVVVELFTSQGCNSCPPADRLLGELAKRDDLIALTYHVDYWDYLGWRDTFASPENTARQRDYADAMQSQRVYTPQIVVAGSKPLVGSQRRAVAEAIDAAQRAPAAGIHIDMVIEDDRVIVRLPDAPAKGDATIWLVRFDRQHEVSIRRGENSGKILKYYNVVRGISNLGLWRGEAMELAFSREELLRGGRDGCAIIVQKDSHGAVIGAARMNLSDPS